MQQAAPEATTFFDVLSEQIVASGLQALVKLVETATVITSFSDWDWTPPIRQSNVQVFTLLNKPTEVTHLERRLRQPAEDSPFRNEFLNLRFLTLLERGDQFPVFSRLSWLSSQQPAELRHRPGEVMLAVFWENPNWHDDRIMQHIQKMFEGSEGGLRLVAINCSQDRETAIETVLQRELTVFQHYFSGSREDNSLQPIAFQTFPSVYLVDQRGYVIQAASGRQAKLNWADIVRKLIQKRIPEKFEENTKGHFGQETLKRYESFTKTRLKSDMPYRLDTAMKIRRTLEKGLLAVEVEPIYMLLSMDEPSEDLWNSLQKHISEHFESNEYYLYVTGDRKLDLQNEYNKVANALLSIGIKQRPFFRHQTVINVRYCNCGQSFGEIVLPIPENRTQITKKTIDSALSPLKNRPDELRYPAWISIKYDPFFYVGLQFQGINNLVDVKNQPTEPILPIGGMTQVITFFFKSQVDTKENILRLEEELSHYPDTAILHIISSSITELHVDKLFGQKAPNVKLYNSNIKGNKNIQFFLNQKELPRFTIVINREQRIAFCGQLEEYSELKEVLEGEKKEFARPSLRLASPSTIQKIDLLQLSDPFQQVKRSVSFIKYYAGLTISYTEARDHPSAAKAVTVPKVRCTLREADRKLVEPLRDYMSDAEFNIKIVPTIQLPLGDTCQDCLTRLELPYFYFFVSKVHRCTTCTLKQNTIGDQQLLKYPVLQNSVLIFKDRLVDTARLGKNIQPRAQNECKNHQFNCDGCGEGPMNEPRYICMGCYREPNDGEYVSFCSDCAKAMVNKDEQKTIPIFLTSKMRGHDRRHPLLRVLYEVISEKEF